MSCFDLAERLSVNLATVQPCYYLIYICCLDPGAERDDRRESQARFHPRKRWGPKISNDFRTIYQACVKAGAQEAQFKLYVYVWHDWRETTTRCVQGQRREDIHMEPLSSSPHTPFSRQPDALPTT